MADNEGPDARMGEAVIEAFGATTSLLDPQVPNAGVGIAFRDELRRLGFDIVPIGQFNPTVGGDRLQDAEAHGA
jgi:hypothetical protein